MTDDDEYLMHPHHDVLQQEFAALYDLITDAMGGSAPAAIGDKIDGLANSIIAFEEELLDAIRRRDEEIATLRAQIRGGAE